MALTSSIGLHSPAAVTAASAIRSGVSAWPSSIASAFFARSTTGATAPSAMRAIEHLPPSAATVTATPVIVIASPLRRASL